MAMAADPRLADRTWDADPEQVVLSWPSYFSAGAPIHRAISNLDYGDGLNLRPRGNGKSGWEITEKNGIAVARLAKKNHAAFQRNTQYSGVGKPDATFSRRSVCSMLSMGARSA